MLLGKKIIVVLPAYNAGKTLRQTYLEIPMDIVDEVILVDDGSQDNTIAVAKELGITHIILHEKNLGYGGNQKTCYRKSLEHNADIIIMLHPDYQYAPSLIPSMAYLIAQDIFPVVLGSRILGNGAIKGGMPVYKYWANRFLTFVQNLVTNAKMSEYHTGYRAFDANVIRQINIEANSDDFIFDNQILSQIIMKGHVIAEITCPTKYMEHSSSINFSRSLLYGLGVLKVTLEHWLHKNRIVLIKRYQE